MEKIFFIVLATILISLPVYSSIITTANGAINCDGIICPDNSTSCIVTKQTFGDDLKFYKYTRLCSDASGLSTKSVEQELPNPIPGTIINSISSFGGAALSDEERKKLEANIEQMVKEQQQYWQNWTSDFYAKMRKQFPPGFPFN